MPLYKYDQDTLDMFGYALATYKFRNYLSGFADLSAYLSGLCFERIIVQTGRKFPKLNEKVRRGKDLAVREVIDFLKRYGQIEREEERILRNCWNFRGAVMHQGSSIGKDKIVKGTGKVLRKICTMIEIDFEKELENKEFEDILKFGERKRQVEHFGKIVDSDFDKFIGLYAKCPALQQELNRILRLPLFSEEISEFVPNTGGIWLPWVTEKAGKRSHMRRASLGVTFTPNNLRIGLDFGSKAYIPKEQFYTLLLKGSFNRMLTDLDDEYRFYDTFWYYNIRNEHKIKDYLDPSVSKIIKSQIKDAYSEVRLQMLQGKPIARAQRNDNL